MHGEGKAAEIELSPEEGRYPLLKVQAQRSKQGRQPGLFVEQITAACRGLGGKRNEPENYAGGEDKVLCCMEMPEV